MIKGARASSRVGPSTVAGSVRCRAEGKIKGECSFSCAAAAVKEMRGRQSQQAVAMLKRCMSCKSRGQMRR
jgi:hypothetical protein